MTLGGDYQETRDSAAPSRSTQKRNGNAYSVTDHEDMPQKLIGAKGATLWSAEYEALGEAHVEAAISFNNPAALPWAVL